jgi:hypothetical protein
MAEHPRDSKSDLCSEGAKQDSGGRRDEGRESGGRVSDRCSACNLQETLLQTFYTSPGASVDAYVDTAVELEAPLHGLLCKPVGADKQGRGGRGRRRWGAKWWW